MITPNIVISNLRRIADKIDSSKNPSRSLVYKDIEKILSFVSMGETPDPVKRNYKWLKKGDPTGDDDELWDKAWSMYCKHLNPSHMECKEVLESESKRESERDV